MWFIFPQIEGLGQIPTARHFAIQSLDEARAYLDHPLLGTRYIECVQALQDLPFSDPVAVFGPVDAVKLRSSLTLFEAARPHPLFTAALERWFASFICKSTFAHLSSWTNAQNGSCISFSVVLSDDSWIKPLWKCKGYLPSLRRSLSSLTLSANRAFSAALVLLTCSSCETWVDRPGSSLFRSSTALLIGPFCNVLVDLRSITASFRKSQGAGTRGAERLRMSSSLLGAIGG
jgi:uncharacterized protein (DUF1810 family)